jgi:hypothetical protein
VVRFWLSVLAAIAGLVFGLLTILPPAANADTLSYAYDSMQRLTRVTYPDGTAVDYVCEALGNHLVETTTLVGTAWNAPLTAVSNPSIAKGVTDVAITATLSWSPTLDLNSNGSVVYFIYCGASPRVPLAFSELRRYGWQVVPRHTEKPETGQRKC